MIETIDMNHAGTRLLGTADAIARLGVSRQTLYSYVSRGLIRVTPAPGDPRRSLYETADVDALVERRRIGRARRDVAASTTNWGEPILRSSLTRIADGRFSYRGQDALTLADTASLEDVAALLWSCTVRPGEDTTPVLAASTPLERCLLVLAQHFSHGPREVDAASLLRLVTGALSGRGHGGTRPAHAQFAAAWGLDTTAEDIVRRALVLCADHELNASAYAARVVASTRASLAACVLAGLAALSGPRHGGMTDRVVHLFADPEVIADPIRALGRILSHGREIPGFGHRLYPQGDPRAAALLAVMPPSAPIRRVIDAAVTLTGKPPTLDVALANLEANLSLPPGSGFAVFAAGRTVGWIAHALEQRATGYLIRPRAEYVMTAG